MSRAPGGPDVPTLVIFLPTIEQTALRLEKEAKQRQAATDRQAELALQEAKAIRQVEVDVCQRLFDSISSGFRVNLLQAVEDLNAVRIDPRAETKTDTSAASYHGQQPVVGDNRMYRRVMIVRRSVQQSDDEYTGRRGGAVYDDRAVAEKFQPLYPQCSSFAEAVAIHIKYGQHAEAVFGQGMFLLRTQQTGLYNCQSAMLPNLLLMDYFLVPAWTDRDLDPAAMSDLDMSARDMTTATLARDLKLHGLTDAQIQLCVYGSGHEAREARRAEREAERAVEQARLAAEKPATGCCCVVM